MDAFLRLFAKGQLCFRVWARVDQSCFVPRKELDILD
jgi:hypothetical protein